jgi:tricorn protease
VTNQGYHRFPAIHGDRVYFVSEDDIWRVPASGGSPTRLTAGLGEMGKMAVSPDGSWLAVTAREEKHTEVYVTPATGGPLRRVTYLGAECEVRGFTPEGEILFTSNAHQPFARMLWMFHVRPEGGEPQCYSFGPALDCSFGPSGGMVLGRNTTDPARWKRYRGGRVGKLWIDDQGQGQFRRMLADLNGNIASPMWIGNRIYFVSDHEGIGNIYSCNTTGTDLRRHTNHKEYFARWASTDGRRIVYQCGGDLVLFDPGSARGCKVDIQWHGPSTQTQRRFVRVERFLEDFTIHPDGHSLAIDCRGKPLTLGFWEGAVTQHGIREGVRYRLPQWLSDRKTIAVVSDASGEERLEILREDGSSDRLEDLDIGRTVTMAASPVSSLAALTNHRRELLLIDIEAKTLARLDQSFYRRIEHIAWSPDGAWLAYDFATSRETAAIKLCEVATRGAFLATTPEFRDFAPAFDPGGKFLYFLSHRAFDPVYDSLYFDLNFPRSVKPCLLILSREEDSPFVPKVRPVSEERKANSPAEDVKKLRVDADGIQHRILAFPVSDGIYRQIAGLQGKVLFTSFPLTGSLNSDWTSKDLKGGDLQCFDFSSHKCETILKNVAWFATNRDASTLVYRTGNRLRAVNATGKIEAPANDAPSRETGWIDLSRVKLSVEPRAEWKQMFRDIWRLQREYFWVEDMSGVDWQRVFERYQPLLDRVSTRSEFSDLVWEMQGELGTSHAYELGGDYRPAPEMPLGHLGADFVFDVDAGCYRVAHIVTGDSWDTQHDSPLNAPGVAIKPNDRLLAVAGRPLGLDLVPESQLVHQSGAAVELTVADADGSNVRHVTVTTLKSDMPARYREWVEKNRRFVHEQSNGRTGYIHIPDMGPRGYSEFHRYYSLEAERESVIIDVRYNGGGHVSSLILEKLNRKPLGFDFSRWGVPVPYPPESVLGPIVAITNEHAGSDGDMFSHAFKMLKLGPLIGKRTWGGVIGISPRHRLVDGSVTTQPEYSFWFKDVGWGVENYGTDPDIDVDITPQDYSKGRDIQLERAIDLILKALEGYRPQLPDISNRPRLPLPEFL